MSIPSLSRHSITQHLSVVHSQRNHVPMLLEPGFPFGEDLLQFIWERRAYDGHALRTIDGRPVEVLSPGRIQRNSGPDLVEARIRVDGQLWSGTVEVHLRSSEWNAHGHQYDPAYENVILHVVYEHDQEVRTMSGRSLPTLELLPRVSTDSIQMHHALMTAREQVPCSSQIHTADPFRTGQWLERVLVERLERKTVHVRELFERLQKDPAATLQHLVMMAFGMKVNAEPFAMLANALPLKTLLKYRDDVLRTEALLFGQAGLLQVDFLEEYPRELQREHQLLVHMHGLRTAPLAAWKFARMRPVNFPTLRIAQFAQFFIQLDGDLGALLALDDVRELRRKLDVTASAYWNDHYQFDKRSTPVAKRLGMVAADHIIINAVIPALFAFGGIMSRALYKERALHLLEQLPAEKNAVIGAWQALGLKADTAARGQALLELKNTYCLHRRCLHCAIGSDILKRTAPL